MDFRIVKIDKRHEPLTRVWRNGGVSTKYKLSNSIVAKANFIGFFHKLANRNWLLLMLVQN